jgi:hypothetical protein
LNHVSLQGEIFGVPIESAAADSDDLFLFVCHSDADISVLVGLPMS